MPLIERLIYFSHGCGAQYKNFKNFENLKYNSEGFNLEADWHFLPHLMPKIHWMELVAQSRVAGNASLQRTIKEPILTPKQLFLYADSEIKEELAFISAKKRSKKNRAVLVHRLSQCKTIPGTR